MAVEEAGIEDTLYGRNPDSEGWFVLNLGDALAMRNEAKGGAFYPLEPRGRPSPTSASTSTSSGPASRARSTTPGACGRRSSCSPASARWSSRSRNVRCAGGTSSTARRARATSSWAPATPCAILMIGARPEVEELHYPASGIAAKHGASVVEDTPNPDEAYADWPGDYAPVRLPWPVE